MTGDADRPAGVPPSEDSEHIRRAIQTVLAQRPMPWRPRPFPGERRRRLIGRVVFVLLLVGAVTGSRLMPSGTTGSGTSWFPLVVVLIGWTALLALRSLGGRREAAKVVVPARGMVCPECHFILDEKMPEGVCPECGTRYTRSELIRMWRSNYGLRDQLPDPVEPFQTPTRQ